MKTKRKKPNPPRSKTGAKWNYEPAEAWRGTVIIGKSERQTWWCAELEGTRRKCVKVQSWGGPFFIDDEDGRGSLKVFERGGGPDSYHASIPVDDAGSFIPENAIGQVRRGEAETDQTASSASPAPTGSPSSSQAEAVRLYAEWLLPFRHGDGMDRFLESESILEDLIYDLRGKNLACFCKPGTPCHADVLLGLANAEVRRAAETVEKSQNHNPQ